MDLGASYQQPRGTGSRQRLGVPGPPLAGGRGLGASRQDDLTVQTHSQFEGQLNVSNSASSVGRFEKSLRVERKGKMVPGNGSCGQGSRFLHLAPWLPGVGVGSPRPLMGERSCFRQDGCGRASRERQRALGSGCGRLQRPPTWCSPSAAQPEPQRRAGRPGEAAREQHLHGQGPAQVREAPCSGGWGRGVAVAVGGLCGSELGRGCFCGPPGLAFPAWPACAQAAGEGTAIPVPPMGRSPRRAVCTPPEPADALVCGAGAWGCAGRWEGVGGN